MHYSLPAVSEFLSQTITQSLKQALQPAGLFSAAVLVLATLALVVMPLAASDTFLQPAASTVRNLDPVWLSVLLAALVVTVAYVLLGLQSTILRLATGEAWEGTETGREWLQVQKDKLDDLVKEISNLDTKYKTATDEDKKKELAVQLTKLEFRRETHFPKEKEHIAPTDLGNRLNAIASSLKRRYGADLTALWASMQIALSDDEDKERKALKERIDNEGATLDFLLSLALVLSIAAVECLLVGAFVLSWQVLGFPVLLALAYVVYRAAVIKSSAWGQAVHMAFDQCREDLRELLNLPEKSGLGNQRPMWTRASYWYLWGDTDYEDDLWPAPDTTTAKEATFEPSGNIKVDHKAADLIELRTENDPEFEESAREADNSYVFTRHKKTVRYTLLVSNPVPGEADETKACPAKGVYVMVTEPRIPWVDAVPLAKGWLGERIGGKQILWRLEDPDPLPPNGGQVLHYCLPDPHFTLITNYPKLTIADVRRDVKGQDTETQLISYTFSVSNQSEKPIEGVVDVFDKGFNEPDMETQPEIGGVPLDQAAQPLFDPHLGYRVTLPKIAVDGTITVNLDANSK